jgi:hypothetical protein
MLEKALELAVRLGYTVRQDCFAGSGGGECELQGRNYLFLDLDLGPKERLEQVADVLRHAPTAPELPMPPELRELLGPIANP